MRCLLLSIALLYFGMVFANNPLEIIYQLESMKYEVRRMVLEPQTPIRKVDQEYEKARRARLEAHYRAVLDQAEVRELYGQLVEARLDWFRLQSDRVRLTKVAELSEQLRQVLEKNPEVQQAESDWRAADKRYISFTTRILRSDKNPISRTYWELLQEFSQTEMGAERRDEFLLFPDNPLHLSFRNARQAPDSILTRERELSEWMAECMRTENPGTPPKIIDLIVDYRYDISVGLPTELLEFEEGELDPAIRIYRIIRGNQKGEIDREQTLEELNRLLNFQGFVPVTRLVICEIMFGIASPHEQSKIFRNIREYLGIIHQTASLRDRAADFFAIYQRRILDGGRPHPDRIDQINTDNIGREKFNPWFYAWNDAQIKKSQIYSQAAEAGSSGPRREQFNISISRFQKLWCRNPANLAPLTQLINISEYRTLTATHREMARIQPDFTWYHHLLISSWAGNPRHMAGLIAAAAECPELDGFVPLSATPMLKSMHWRHFEDYRWKNQLKQSGVIPAIDRLYGFYERIPLGEENRNLLLFNYMVWMMNTRRYDSAAEIRQQIALDDAALSALWMQNMRYAGEMLFPLPVVEEYVDPVYLLNLMTGREGAALRRLEENFLSGSKNLNSQLQPFLTRLARSLESPERQVLLDLFVRWMLNFYLQKFSRGHSNLTAYQVAKWEGHAEVIDFLLRNGYDVSGEEAYPGETAIEAAKAADIRSIQHLNRIPASF